MWGSGVQAPHLSQFPNESVAIRTISLAGFGNGVPSQPNHSAPRICAARTAKVRFTLQGSVTTQRGDGTTQLETLRTPRPPTGGPGSSGIHWPNLAQTKTPPTSRPRSSSNASVPDGAQALTGWAGGNRRRARKIEKRADNSVEKAEPAAI
jgi:hypothetical protein